MWSSPNCCFWNPKTRKRDIHLYINSGGGLVTAGMAIYDTMRYVRCAVNTICVGQAASMGAALLAAGERGKRFVLPHAQIMIHQPFGRIFGAGERHRNPRPPHSAAQNAAARSARRAHRQSVKTVAADTERDNFMSATEAVKYGIADKVLTRRVDDKNG